MEVSGTVAFWYLFIRLNLQTESFRLTKVDANAFTAVSSKNPSIKVSGTGPKQEISTTSFFEWKGRKEIMKCRHGRCKVSPCGAGFAHEKHSAFTSRVLLFNSTTHPEEDQSRFSFVWSILEHILLPSPTPETANYKKKWEKAHTHLVAYFWWRRFLQWGRAHWEARRATLMLNMLMWMAHKMEINS